MNTSPRKAADAAHTLTDDILQSAGQAVESTKGFSSDVLGKAGEKVRELRRDVPPAMDKLADKAQAFAAKGKELASDATTRVRDQVTHCADATERYVHEKPVQSVLIGVAAGAALAAAALLATRKRD